ALWRPALPHARRRSVVHGRRGGAGASGWAIRRLATSGGATPGAGAGRRLRGRADVGIALCAGQRSGVHLLPVLSGSMKDRRPAARARDVVMWGAVVFFAVQIGLGVAIDCGLWRFRDPFYQHKIVHLRRQWHERTGGQPGASTRLVVML